MEHIGELIRQEQRNSELRGGIRFGDAEILDSLFNIYCYGKSCDGMCPMMLEGLDDGHGMGCARHHVHSEFVKEAQRNAENQSSR